MTKSLLLVLTRPTGPDTEATYNDWYDQIHLAEVVGTIKSLTAASRYDFVDSLNRTTKSVAGDGGDLSGPFGYPYAALYEIEDDDPEGVVQEILGAAGRGDFDLSETLDQQLVPPVLLLLKPRDEERSVSHHS
jgi:hypothetical protein